MHVVQAFSPLHRHDLVNEKTFLWLSTKCVAITDQKNKEGFETVEVSLRFPNLAMHLFKDDL